jgi:geranylgeranyl reductase family protein
VRGSRFDVAVVGGGPAGAVAGHELGRRGLTVVIVERQRIPRDKVCAGGLQARVLARLPFDLRPLKLNECSGIAFTRRFGSGFVRRTGRALVHQVDRPRFDELLLRRAVEAGAVLRDGLAVADVDLSGSECRLRCAGGDVITADYVVFGDGACGIGYRTLNRRELRFVQLGMTCEAPAAVWRQPYDRSLMCIDWGTAAGAYAWVFPKEDRLAIGCAGPARDRSTLNAYLESVVRWLGLEPARCTRPRAWPMPSFRDGVRLANDRAVLVGDAAGMVDPMSGEGIADAIDSGRLAAESICRVTEAGACLEPIYLELAGRRLLPALRAQMRIRRFCELAPGVVHRLFATDDRLWQLFCAMVYGEAEPGELRRNAWFAPLWPAIDAVAWLVSGVRSVGMSDAGAFRPDPMVGDDLTCASPTLSGLQPTPGGGSARRGPTV